MQLFTPDVSPARRAARYITGGLIAGLFVVAAGCRKDDVARLSYDDTLCFDPWDRGSRTEDVLAEIRATLEAAGIRVLSIDEDRSSIPEWRCEACHCNSGIVYYLETDAEDVAKAQAIGFELAN